MAFVPAADHVTHEPGSVVPFFIWTEASAGFPLAPQLFHPGQRQLTVTPPETFSGRPGS